MDNVDQKIRFLEMIQSIIGRMASNSFMLKGWAVTLVAGTFALSKDFQDIFLLIVYVPIILFWFLDSYYLQLERKYRTLYNKVTCQSPKIVDFKLNIEKSSYENKTSYIQCLISITEFGFYFPTAILVAFVIVLYLYRIS